MNLWLTGTSLRDFALGFPCACRQSLR